MNIEDELVQMWSQKAEQAKQEEAPVQQTEEAPAQEQVAEETQDSSLTEEKQNTEEAPMEVVQDTTPTEEAPAQEPKEEVQTFDYLEFFKSNKELIEFKTKDFDSVDLNNDDQLVDVIVQKYIQDGYTEQEANLMLEKEFPTSFEEGLDAEDEDVKKLLDKELVWLKKLGRESVAELKAKQTQLELDLPNTVTSANSKDSVIEEYVKSQQEQYQKQFDESIQLREKIAEDALQAVKELTFKTKEGQELKVQVEEEDAKWAREEIKDLPNFFQRHFTDKDGNIDQEGLIKALYKLKPENDDKLLQIAIGYGNGKGVKQVLTKDFKNISMGQNTSANSNQTYTGNDPVSQITKAVKEGKLDLSKAF